MQAFTYSSIHLAAGLGQRAGFRNPAIVGVNGMAEVRVDLLDTVQLVQREAVWVLVLQLFENLDLAVTAADASI